MPSQDGEKTLGRPTKYDPEFHPQDFIRLSKLGKTFAQIAGAWEVDRDTIKEWQKVHPVFSAAVKIGRQFAEYWYIELGQKAMTGRVRDPITGEKVKVDLGWFCWMTKNMFKWSDKVQVDNRTEIVDVDKEKALIEWLSKVGKE